MKYTRTHAAWLLSLPLTLLACGTGGGAGMDANANDASDGNNGNDVGANTEAGAGDAGGVRVPTDHGFAMLSDYGIFVGDQGMQQPAPGVIPYDVNAPLFSDYAHKRRFLYVPPGGHITFQAAAGWDLPPGSVLVKTFSFPTDERDPSLGERLIETRLLVRTTTGWFAETYQWNAAQTDAARFVSGGVVPVSWIDAQGTARTDDFTIPNRVECEQCHGALDPTRPNPMHALGLRTGQLNRAASDPTASGANQIDRLAMLGLFDTAPPAADTLERFATLGGSDPTEAQARAYLHANCAHCHNPESPNSFGGLYLNVETTDPARYGACKIPTSASDTGGFTYDILPGDPDHSILPYRMQLTHTTSMMPPLGRNLVDDAGLDLVRRWIAGMPASTCR